MCSLLWQDCSDHFVKQYFVLYIIFYFIFEYSNLDNLEFSNLNYVYYVVYIYIFGSDIYRSHKGITIM